MGEIKINPIDPTYLNTERDPNFSQEDKQEPKVIEEQGNSLEEPEETVTDKFDSKLKEKNLQAEMLKENLKRKLK